MDDQALLKPRKHGCGTPDRCDPFLPLPIPGTLLSVLLPALEKGFQMNAFALSMAP